MHFMNTDVMVEGSGHSKLRKRDHKYRVNPKNKAAYPRASNLG